MSEDAAFPEQVIRKEAGKFRGFDVGRILVAEAPALHPQNEAERLDVAGQVLERESGLAPIETMKLKGLEVACQNVARPVALGERVKILPCLPVGAGRIAPGVVVLPQPGGPQMNVNACLSAVL